MQNIHLITHGKVQYQSQATRGFATRVLRLVLDLAIRDSVDILQFLIYFFWRFPQYQRRQSRLKVGKSAFKTPIHTKTETEQFGLTSLDAS